MSIEQLTSIQQQFTKHLQTIRNQSKTLPKSIILRISAWLKKLCSVVDNYFWRKNRNLYAQVLALMLVQNNLQSPFDKSPPDGSLPKLTIYQIPFSIREKLECNKNKNQEKQKQKQKQRQRQRSKQNCFELANLTLHKINSTEINNLRCKKRQSFVLKSLKSINDNCGQENTQSIHIETQRKNKSKNRQMHQYKHPQQQKYMNNIQKAKQKQKQIKIKKQKNNQNKILINTLQDVLYFLAKNNQQFQQDIEYIKLIEEIVQFGDDVGKNFKQMKFSMINQ